MDELKALSREQIQLVAGKIAEKVCLWSFHCFACPNIGSDGTRHTTVQVLVAVDMLDSGNENTPAHPDLGTVEEAELYIRNSVVVLRAHLECCAANVPARVEDVILDISNSAMLGLPDHPTIQEAVAKLCLDYFCSEAPRSMEISVQLVCSCFVLPQTPDASQPFQTCGILR